MKTITAKEFQLQHAAIMKAVAAGAEFEVTFHRKPIVRLTPAQSKKQLNKNLKPGSREAVLDSLRYSVVTTGDFHDLPYDVLKDRMMNDKYGIK